MDLHLIPGAAATADERAAVDSATKASDIGGTHSRRHLLLPVLHAVQRRIGWISEGALNYICEQLSVPPADAYGVATFYAMFSLAPRPPSVIHVCDDIACRMAGGEALCAQLEQALGVPAGTGTIDGRAIWLRSPCLGQCERAPAVLYQIAGEGCADWTLTEANADSVIAGLEGKPIAAARPADSVPQAAPPRASGLRLLRRVGIASPESLDDYRAHGGYSALRQACTIGPERVIREITDARLVGRGGAAFPTGRKWEAVARSPVRPHYVVCNADESEPGTFKDRVLMEEDPFAVIEAMTIAGFVTGCETGFLYIRGEYPLATARLEAAIEQSRLRGFLGSDVLGEGFRFDIELRRGAGAYICGEETALFNSIEGLRGVKALAWGVAVIIASLNVWLLYQTLAGM